MARQRDNLRAGLFVLLGVVLAFVVIYVLADFSRFTARTRHVKVFYHLSDGVQGLKTGATVTLGDQPVGEVLAINPHLKADGHITGLVVTIAIPEEVKLHWDAEIELVVPPLGSGTRLNIRSVGGSNRLLADTQQQAPLYDVDGQIPANLVPDWAVPRVGPDGRPIDRGSLGAEELLSLYPGPRNAIPGTRAGSTLIKDLATNIGIEGQQREQLRMIIANVEAITAGLRKDLPEIMDKAKSVATKADTALDDVKLAMANLRETTEKVKGRVDPWTEKIDATLTDVRALSADARQAIGDAKELVAEKKPALGQMVDNFHTMSGNLKEVSAKLKDQTFQQVTDAMDKAQAALENLKTATAKARDLMTGQKPTLERTLANAQIMSDQLKLAAIEIRRSPWRLLYAPTEEELETDNLYDAARTFAQAAGALDSAARSLQAVTATGQADSQEVQEIMRHLTAIFGEFRKVEQTFWKELESRGAARPAAGDAAARQ